MIFNVLMNFQGEQNLLWPLPFIEQFEPFITP